MNCKEVDEQGVNQRSERVEPIEQRVSRRDRTEGVIGPMNIRVPRIPRVVVPYPDAPIDLNGREPNASTVFACNLCYEATEERILEYFNGINGTFDARERNVIVAVNFVYRKSSSFFDGKAFFFVLYTVRLKWRSTFARLWTASRLWDVTLV